MNPYLFNLLRAFTKSPTSRESVNPAFGAATPGEVDYTYAGDPEEAIQRYGSGLVKRPSFWQQVMRPEETRAANTLNLDYSIAPDLAEQNRGLANLSQRQTFATTRELAPIAEQQEAGFRRDERQAVSDFDFNQRPRFAAQDLDIREIAARRMFRTDAELRQDEFNKMLQTLPPDVIKRLPQGLQALTGGSLDASKLASTIGSVSDIRLNTPHRAALRQNFEETTGTPLGRVAETPFLSRVEGNTVISTPNTQYTSPQSLAIKDAMASMSNMKAPTAAEIAMQRMGRAPVNPGMVFTGETGAAQPTARPEMRTAPPPPTESGPSRKILAPSERFSSTDRSMTATMKLPTDTTADRIAFLEEELRSFGKGYMSSIDQARYKQLWDELQTLQQPARKPIFEMLTR